MLHSFPFDGEERTGTGEVDEDEAGTGKLEKQTEQEQAGQEDELVLEVGKSALWRQETCVEG